MATNRDKSLRQPKVFALSITTALFERCGFYVLAFLMVLYTKSQFGFSDKYAFALYGILNALVFLTPALGGYLADNIIGIRRTILLGMLIEGTGLIVLSIPTKPMFILALALVIVGVGFFKTGPTDLLARSYKDEDPRIDRGFTLYYMAMNIGSLFSPVVAGLLQKYFSWQIAFTFGALSLYANIAVYYLLRHRARGVDAKIGYQKLPFKTILLLPIGIVAAIAGAVFLLNYATAAHIFFIIATILVCIYFAYEISRSPKREKMEIIACLALILMGMVFFIMYFQYYMSITLFIKRCIRHNIFGYNVPTAPFLSLNAFWIIVLSPVLVWFYGFLSKTRGKDLSITTKFPLGLLIMSLCFFTLKLGTYFPNSHAQISSLWLVVAILLYSLGELLISALGVAMVTRIAPKRMYGVMMGAWFLIAAALASSLSGSVASLSSIPETLKNPTTILNIYSKAFLMIGIGGIIATIIAFLISPYIKKIAHIK